MTGKKKKTSSSTKSANAPADTPKEYICELCQRLMSEPVKTVYGNVMEKAVIEEWLSKHGHICPLTGAPLSESDLTAHKELKTKIQKWILQKSMNQSNEGDGNKYSGKNISPEKKKEDDLYDF